MSAGQNALDQLDERVRLLGSTLVKLGWDTAFHQWADRLPEVRERLHCVGKMTGAAASRVLDLVDAALPDCKPAAEQAEALSIRLEALSEHPALGVGEARAALAEAAAVLAQQGEIAGKQFAVLSDIRMAQDFQDLSGSVINEVVQIISRTEQQLRQLLVLCEVAGLPAVAVNPLQGLQVPDKTVAQRDVDALMAALRF